MASTCAQVGGLSRPWRSTDEFRSITISEPRINDRIRVPEVRLIGPGGEQVGVVATGVALKLAQDADLDLVEVAPDARPPVAKLMDYGKFKYESDMKAREARRNQANTVLKEIRFRLKIDPHDYGTKKGHVVRFLEAGDKVKVMIMFRGREQSRPEMGVRLLQRLAEDVSDLGFVESMPKQDGRNMTMVLGPVKKKADAKVEQRKRSSEINAQRKTKSEVKAEARAQAAPAQPAPEPEPTEPEVEAQEAPAPEAAQPAPAPRAETKPAVAPAASKPATSKPATSKPATSKPVAEKSASTPATPAAPAAAPKPATPAKPAAATPKPATPKPATPRPPAPRPKPSPRAGR
ncbi:translation initiation factor IF-3 [Isoptericola sp. NPDC019693]|uniref:translation initiation factor IF-3 n=1 Tax=Isoptericola sp. NPDC019693 TaxID=3364009 RepID=UPI0037997768